LTGISEWACGSDLDTDYEIERNPVSNKSIISFKNGGRIPLDKPGLGLELEKWVKDLINKTRSY
jgi:hypothetical protein